MTVFKIAGRSMLVLLLCSRAATAQPPPQPAGANDVMLGERHEATNNQKDHHYIGAVEFHSADGSTSIYADEAWFYSDENRFVATGHVTFSQAQNQISAERAEFNTKTRLGTFFNASGIATVQQQRPTAPPPGGLAVPTVPGQQLVVYFFGDSVEKLGPKKYKITHGGFTTCVQPTPRWDLHADTVILNIDHYTFMKNVVLSAKGVPMLYVPAMLYPTKSGDRATGVLIPTYGSSLVTGQSIHNAFFWAINRSQDATISHEWYSKLGQGLGTEYRYNYGALADGNFWGHFLDQHEATYVDEVGNENTIGASRSYDIRGSANQMLPGHIRARANVNYFSSIVSSQTFNTNIYDASRNERTFGANLVGAWSGYTMNATIDRSEYFYSIDSSNVSGDGPRIDLSRNERPLFGSPVYFALTSEYANLIRGSRAFDANGSVSTDVNLGVNRFDIWPQIRYPFKKWQWLTVNSMVSWRDTYYTRRAVVDPATGNPETDEKTGQPLIADSSINRRYFSVQAQLVGPVFNRIWDTPENGYAEKFKHSIEPYLTIGRTSSVDDFQEIIKTDGIDSVTGGTNLSYGVVNRFFAKRKLAPGQPAVSREILDVEVSQSYYTNQLQALFDVQYQSSQYSGNTASHFSPYAVSVRAMPTNDFNATFRAEFDSRYNALRTVSANGSYNLTGLLQSSIGWTKTGCIPQQLPPGADCSQFSSQFINPSVNVHTHENHFGSIYNFNYDVTHGGFQQQQITGFYNAQCCGIAFQYQRFSYGGLASIVGVPADHRFFLSFTLAGLGNFSPFNGALGGVPR